jgi:hypothetical protein
LLGSRVGRWSLHQALSKWQYFFSTNATLHELGLAAWRKVVSGLPVRDTLLVCDPRATSPLEVPRDSRVLVTSVRDAQLDHFDEVLTEAESLARAPDVEETFAAMTAGRDRYHFRLPLNPRDVTDPRNDVFVKFAMQPRIAGMVQKYFRIPCRLHEVTVLLDRPTPGPPAESQNWHRDPDDFLTVSLFVYLSDVTSVAAPFCYIPLEQSRKLYGKVGAFREFPTWHVIPDETMESIVPREHWIEVEGPKGTIVCIDSASCYHRGKQSTAARRLSMHLIFTSTMTRMELMESDEELRRTECERVHASESPRYSVASSAPQRHDRFARARP